MALHDLTPQLRTRLRRVEKIVGLFVAVAAAVLLGGFFYYLYHTAERKGWFTPKVTYYTFVQSADGLHVGDPVMLMGFSVGEITVIDAEPPESSYNVFVAFAIKKPYYGYIWTDSKATVTGGALLGGRQMQVTKGRTGLPTAYEEDGRVAEVLVDGQRIAVAKQPQGVPLAPDEAPALAERAERLLAQLEESLPRIIEKLESTMGNVEQLTGRLDGVVEQTRPIIANLNTITTNLKNPDGSMGEWMIPRDLRLRLTTTLENVDANLSVLTGTLKNVDAITGSFRTQVETNADVIGNLSDLVRDTDDLIQGMKRHWLLRSAFPQPEPGEQLRLEPLPGVSGGSAP